MNRVSIPSLLAAALLLALPGCVKKSTYEGTLADLARAREGQEDLRREMRERIEQCEARVAEEQRNVSTANERIAELEAELARTERRRAEADARFEEARTEVHRLELVLRERGGEFRRLEERLRSLAAMEREVRQRNAIYEEVLGRFRSLIDAGRLSVSIDRGRMAIQLPQDILFRSGSADLAQEGVQTLSEVAEVLAELEDRRFQIEGHTDNVPISTARFPSNWELSTARALSVVRLLVDRGVPADNLSGAGYGEFQPVADNADPDGRRRNRRIEIVMLPNLDLIAGTQVPG